MNFQKTHIKSIKFTLQNVINIMVWFGSCDAFTPRLSWVLTAALFREWSVHLLLAAGAGSPSARQKLVSGTWTLIIHSH